ncbi:MAG: peptidylprolyl isomerase [Defluviimonas sp.]|uniref:peptidylprolyl isomerase n=1 Tax=Albidovulum sp. TaxID=1872424 RepID=UPI002A28BFCA|nr:peptidylprolyl isomerase [Defluviimonas sp.]
MLKSAALAGALVLSLAAPGRAEDPTADTVVARVDGVEVTLGEMIAMRETLPQQYLQLPDDVLFNGILDQIVQQVVLAKASDGLVKRRDKLIMENQTRGYLAGVTLDAAANAAATDEALKKLYDEKYTSAELGKEYHAAHILVASEDEALELKKQIDAGADFAALAKEKSTDKGSATAGGDLGWFGVGRMVKPFEDAVVAMEPGTVSDPIETQFGWHIIKLEEIRDATAPAFDDVKEELAGDLRQKAVEEKVKELTDGASVEKSVDGIDPAILKNADLIAN